MVKDIRGCWRERGSERECESCTIRAGGMYVYENCGERVRTYARAEGGVWISLFFKTNSETEVAQGLEECCYLLMARVRWVFRKLHKCCGDRCSYVRAAVSRPHDAH